ncbi:MAG: hypothetical protein LAO20_13990 [Acidobacteriia bacterium]|nr:hypothetical protein [Terriglobia bacterium]
MNPEQFTSYWIGQEPTGPGHSPTLNQMPAYVDVAPLAFVGITSDDQLDFNFLTQQNSAATIQGWIKTVRAQGTKVLLSINSQQFAAIKDPSSFAQTVQNAITEWGVDGIDIDFEPPFQSPTLITVVKQLRSTLGSGTLMTAPVYSAWTGMLNFLGQFADSLDYLTTMDYTGYPGFDTTIQLFNQYAKAIGGPEKLAIGISCMGPPQPASNNFTPLADVIKLCQWEPSQGHKQGAMLYTFSYDIKTRPIKGKPPSGTGYPDGTWTKTIHEKLPSAGRVKAAS